MKKIYIVHVGLSGFPFGSAAINNSIFRYKSLVEEGANVLLINNRAVHKKDIPTEIKKEGSFEGLKYIYTSLSPYKSDKFIVRRLSNFKGKLNEVLLLIKLKFTKRIDVLMFYPTGSFYDLLKYRFISKIFKIQLIVQYVEYRTSFKSRKKIFMRISDYLFDKYIGNLADGVLPISQFLVDNLKKNNCSASILKIPPLVDFDEFNVEKNDKENYFLYCGSAGYLNAISFVIDSFGMINNSDYSLYLVINGNSKQMEKVKKMIAISDKKEYIKLHSKLSYKALVKFYINASAMLIPLSNSLQDEARFPYKISEYCATGNPIITTNFGEVKYYFEDMKSALIANNYHEIEFANKMKFVMDNPEKAKEIGQKAKKVGYNYFHYLNYGKKLIDLIKNIKKAV